MLWYNVIQVRYVMNGDYRLIKMLCLTLCLSVFFSGSALAGGLSSRFVQVRLKDLKPGETYSVAKESGKHLIVKNTTEKITVDLGIDLEVPSEDMLLSGYEPIPDTSWIKVEKDHFKKVGPGGSAKTDLLISIPKDDRYYKKRYQAFIYSHTEGAGMMRAGIMSRLLIETGEKPKPPVKAKPKDRLQKGLSKRPKP